MSESGFTGFTDLLDGISQILGFLTIFPVRDWKE
jgi:hypothetical protein